MGRRLIDPREQFPFLSLGGDNPLGVDERQFGRMLGDVTRQRRDEMPGFRQRQQPGRRGRAMFADKSEGRRTIELELRK